MLTVEVAADTEVMIDGPAEGHLAMQDFVELLDTALLSDELVLPAGEALYLLGEEMLRVRAVYLGSQLVPPVSRQEVARGTIVYDYGVHLSRDWATQTGKPRVAVTDMQSDALRWVPVPDQSYTGIMDCYVYPPRMADGEDPSIPQRWRSELVTGAVARLYRMRDVEVFDPRAAEMYQAQWYTTLAEAYASTQRGQRGANVGRFNQNGVW